MKIQRWNERASAPSSLFPKVGLPGIEGLRSLLQQKKLEFDPCSSELQASRENLAKTEAERLACLQRVENLQQSIREANALISKSQKALNEVDSSAQIQKTNDRRENVILPLEVLSN